MKNKLVFLIITALMVISCGGDTANTSADSPNIPPAASVFSNPREVTIIDYTGDAMEPSISHDGTILFFNNLNSPTLSNGDENDTNIHYARRIDDVTFQYMGEVTGADTDDISGIASGDNELEAVASMDQNNKFYFIRTIDYMNMASPDYLSSIFRGDYVNGTLLNIESLPNLKNDRPANQMPVPGDLNFDAEINYDGDVLYFTDGFFSGNPFPDEADIGVATNVDGVFTVNSDSSDEMAMINTDALEYAPSISTDMLELFFTRFSGSSFGIYVATRSSVSDAWDNINKIEAITGLTTEAPSISFNGRLLYYHQKIADVFRVYVVSRD